MTDGRTRTFHNPVHIRFGPGALSALAELARSRRTIVLTSDGMARRGVLRTVENALGDLVVATYTAVTPNPTVLSCTTAFEEVRAADAELIVAIGGGSVIDTAKAVAAQDAAGTDAWLSAHLREGGPFPADFLPPAILAIPTTAGTGSEVTMWGTIWDERTGKKYSISHPRLYPESAIVDPLLTHSVPRRTTVATAFDALSHAMEAIWNRASNPISDALAIRAIGLIPDALRAVLESPADPDARERLASAALVAGLAMSNTRTALAHSISYPLTAELGVQHGIACSLTLPEILREVGEEFPDRAALIVQALAATSVADAVYRLYALFRSAGAGDELRQHIGSAAALSGLRGSFIAPGRADNFLVAVEQASAAALLRRAYETICA